MQGRIWPPSGWAGRAVWETEVFLLLVSSHWCRDVGHRSLDGGPRDFQA